MSAHVDSAWAIRRMRPRDIDDVLAIETTAYGYPWSERIFRDCLRVGYRAWVIGCPGLTVAGYMLATIAAGEAHVLNLCIDDCARGQRLGERQLCTRVVCELERFVGESRKVSAVGQGLWQLLSAHEDMRDTDGRELGTVLGGKEVGEEHVV